MFKSKFFLFYLAITIIIFCSKYSYPKQENIEQPYTLCTPFNLKTISKLAYQYRQDLESFDYLISANWHNERAALGGFLPQISIFADTGKSSDPGITGSGVAPFPREWINLEISQLIFSYDGPMVQYKIAQQDTHISRTQKEQLENLIRINSETTFLELKKELLRNEVIKNLNDSSRQIFEKDTQRNNVGFFSVIQWNTAKTTYSKDQANVINYPSDVQVAISKLQRETNSAIKPCNISLDYKNIEKITLLSMEEYQKLAMQNRPDLDEQDFRIKQAEYSNEFYKYRYIPELRFGVQMRKSRLVACPPETIRTNGVDVPFENTPLIWHVGLQATWNFDGLSNYNTARKFQDLSSTSILQKRDLELTILKDIKVTYNQLTTLLNLLEPAQKNYITVKSELERVKKAYDVGLAALFEYKQAKLQYQQAKFDLISLKIDIRKNYQGLLFLCGFPKEIS